MPSLDQFWFGPSGEQIGSLGELRLGSDFKLFCDPLTQRSDIGCGAPNSAAIALSDFPRAGRLKSFFPGAK
jgi:hypothetical protein